MTSENSLSGEELERYSRHLVIPEVGIEGQEKLQSASVLVVGAGGLGSPVIQYLAAAGIGTLGLVDFDVVERSNLQRQVLFSTEDIGQNKVDASHRKAASLNPEIVINKHCVRLDSSNVVEVFEKYSIIVDGSDNFETRYLINDACVLLRKPNIHGAVHRFDGQVSVFSSERGPCYRCAFPEPPAPGAVQNCAEAGVLGVLPGLIGTIQATECIKLILSIGTPLIGKLLLVDALDMTFRTIKLSRDLHCTACGDTTGIKSVSDLASKHDLVQPVCSPTNEQQLTPRELVDEIANNENLLLIDVRETHEYSHSHLKNSVHLSLNDLSANLFEIPEAADIVVYCKSGARSQKAATILLDAGIKCRSLTGGLNAWSKQVDTSMSVL